ncbi:VOC family protein [Thiohalorhabdus sp. Cl-TMA]|uniref:VOC family protein n=1 Tax=Thiohalorhabdus methylotrophus TaxID=3242694 RepID=A0ABV4U0Y4_9GAMM
MHAIVGMDHIGLRVTELARTRRFYEKLGFVFLDGPLGPEPVAIMEHPAGVNLNLILNGDESLRANPLMDYPEKPAGYTHVALRVSDAREVQEDLRAQGIAVSEGPVELGGGLSLFVRDPDRNVVELHQPGTGS